MFRWMGTRLTMEAMEEEDMQIAGVAALGNQMDSSVIHDEVPFWSEFP